jgi:hypothetical protein
MPRHTPPCLLAIAAALALLAGCGGDPPPSPPGSTDNPLVARTPTPGEPQAREPGTTRTTTRPGFERLVESQSRRPARRFTPCLVTRAQARAIVGEPVKLPFEAPQGPTCVYRTEKGHGLVTVAVQDVGFRKVSANVQQPRKFEIARRTGICGQYGQPTLYVPVSGGRVLTVAAPCTIAKKFAAHAVRRLGG